MTENSVGLRIKRLRESKNISLEDMAERSGIPSEQILSIENDECLPSLGPLIKVARVLGVRLGTFLDDDDSLGPVVHRAGEKAERIAFSNGSTDAHKNMDYLPLAQQKSGRHIEPFLIDIQPATSAETFAVSAHEGEEFIYVLAGKVEVEYGKEKYTLSEGDSIFYDSIVGHHVHGADDKPAKILAVVYTPF